MSAYLLLAGLAFFSPVTITQDESPARPAPIRDPDVIYFHQGGPNPPSLLTRMVKLRVHNVRASDISESLGGATIDFGSDRATQAVSPWSNGAWAANLLPQGIDSLLALPADNTLIVRFSDEESLRELLGIVRALDVKPRTMEVAAEAEFIFTDRSGKVTRSALTAKGATIGERRLHLKSRKEDGGPLFAQTSDVDVYARRLEDGTVSLAADWYVDVTVAGSGQGGRSTAKNVYRTDAVVPVGKTVTAAHATLALASGKVELTLRLTPRPAEPVASQGGRKLSSAR